MSRASALEKLATARRLLDQAEAELRALEDPACPATPAKISEIDRARARKALERRGYRP